MTDEAPESSPSPNLSLLEHGFCFETRTIWIGDICNEEAAKFVKVLYLMQAQGDAPVHLLVSSSGGDWFGALAMYDAIRDCDTIVSCEVFGKCFSAAAALVQACDSRWIHPNATMMIHDGYNQESGDVRSVENWAEHSKRDRDRMYKILAEKSTKPASFFRKKCAHGDYILTAHEAHDLGLFDAITREQTP